MTSQVTIDGVGNIIDGAGKIIGQLSANSAPAVAQAAPVVDKATQEAINQSSGSAAVIDSLATHLGNAADNLATKIQQIIEHYGPGAVQLIHEIGRVKALTDVGYFVIAGAFLWFSLFHFLKAWNAYDALESKHGYYGESLAVRIGVFGIASFGSALFFAVTFSLAAIYGVASPEAYLIMKLIKL